MNETVYRAILQRLGVGPGEKDRQTVPPEIGPPSVIGTPLDHFALEGVPLEVRVPGLLVTLWFVPTEADAEVLTLEGVTRGRVWTARELIDLLNISGLSSQHVQTICAAKLEFGRGGGAAEGP